jgi:hypothetical protein
LDDFDWHDDAITTRADARYPELPQHAERPPLPARRVRRRLQVRPALHEWIKDGTPKTMGAVADEWRRRQGDAR